LKVAVERVSFITFYLEADYVMCMWTAMGNGLPVNVIYVCY